MHGLMWYFHEDHHVHEPGFFEKNDAFFLIFAVPSAWCFITGSMAGGDFRVDRHRHCRLWLGVFPVHDIFIHQRFKIFTRTENVYLMAIRKAHKVPQTSAKRTENALACSGCRGNTSLMPAKPCAPNANQTG